MTSGPFAEQRVLLTALAFVGVWCLWVPLTRSILHGYAAFVACALLPSLFALPDLRPGQYVANGIIGLIVLPGALYAALSTVVPNSGSEPIPLYWIARGVVLPGTAGLGVGYMLILAWRRVRTRRA